MSSDEYFNKTDKIALFIVFSLNALSYLLFKAGLKYNIVYFFSSIGFLIYGIIGIIRKRIYLKYIVKGKTAIFLSIIPIIFGLIIFIAIFTV